MSLHVALETERGERLELVIDLSDILSRSLPAHDDESYQCLRYIDRYGDTVFNRLQMEVFLNEWERLGVFARTKEEKAFIEEVETLAQRCLKEPHFYLKFIGD